MPFIRYTRDKRGYETTFVMHGYRPGHGSGRARVLYLFRSPAHIKVGRAALDEEAREALEHTHPDLSFDWSALGRDAIMPRADDPRDRRGAHRQAPRPQPSSRPPAAQAPEPPRVVIDDQSTLGRALGAETALRLRARYGELLQRIARRARTPEERDRLTDRAQRLNPDDWPDEATARAASAGIEADWDLLAAELPSRRRGRRGGRRRPADEEPGAAQAAETHDTPGADAAPAEPSGIIGDAGDADANTKRGEVADQNWGTDPAGDDDRHRSGPGPAGDDIPVHD